MNLERRTKKIVLVAGISALAFSAVTNLISMISTYDMLHNQDFSEFSKVYNTKKSEGKGDYQIELEIFQEARQINLADMGVPSKIAFYTLVYPGERVAEKVYKIWNGL